MSEYRYTHVTRRELRAMVASGLGFDPDGDASDSVYASINEYIRRSALKALQKMPWYWAQSTQTFDVGVEQGEIGFPAGCGPGSILQVSIFLNDDDFKSASLVYPQISAYPRNQYVPLIRSDLTNTMDSDPLWDAGGDDMDKVTGTPTMWGVRDRILIRPYTDKSYPMKILYTEVPELVCDDDKTAIDGEVILLFATAMYYRQAEEFGNADRYEADAIERIRELRGQQSSGENMEYSAGISFRRSPDEEALLLSAGDRADYAFGAPGQTYDGTSRRSVNPEGA